MSNIVKGAAAIRTATEQKDFADYGWFKLGDGESVRVRFLQELDYESDGYDEEAGVGALVTFFTPPVENGFLHRYVVDDDNEDLLERIPDWEVNTRLFINVLTERDGEWKHEIWNASKTTARSLLEWSDEFEGLTNQVWKVKRSGKGKQTQYLFMAKPNDDLPEFEGTLVDIEEDLLKPLTPAAIAEHGAGASSGSGDDEDGQVDDSLNW